MGGGDLGRESSTRRLLGSGYSSRGPSRRLGFGEGDRLYGGTTGFLLYFLESSRSSVCRGELRLLPGETDRSFRRIGDRLAGEGEREYRLGCLLPGERGARGGGGEGERYRPPGGDALRGCFPRELSYEGDDS